MALDYLNRFIKLVFPFFVVIFVLGMGLARSAKKIMPRAPSYWTGNISNTCLITISKNVLAQTHTVHVCHSPLLSASQSVGCFHSVFIIFRSNCRNQYQETVSQGKTCIGQGCKSECSSLNTSTLASVKGTKQETYVRQSAAS